MYIKKSEIKTEGERIWQESCLEKKKHERRTDGSEAQVWVKRFQKIREK